MMFSATDDNINDSFLQRYQEGLEEKSEQASMFPIVFIYCIITFIKQDWEEADHT